MTDNYDHSDVMQALATALEFGDEGAGKYGTNEDGDLLARGGLTIHVSEAARDLIGEARELVGGQYHAFGMYPPPFSHRDVERATAEALEAREYLDRVERGECDLADESQEEEDGATLVEDIAEAVAALWRVVAHLEELAEEPAHRAAANAEACRISEWCQELRTIKEEAQR